MSTVMPLPAFAATVLVVVATALTAFGLRRPRPPGWGWWIAAPWLSAAGAAAAALPPLDRLAPALLLAWPVLALAGLRRFHPRQSLPGGDHRDAAVLATAAGVALLGAAWGGEYGAALVTGAPLLTHLYAALLLFLGRGGREATPVLGLGATMALVAFAPGIASLSAGAFAAPPLPGAAAAALGNLVFAVVVITLVCERTERQLRESRRRLRALANLDSLTEVPNRRHFDELASQALRHDPPGSAVLLMFDIDHFKQINDHLGHAAGDRALRVVAGAVLEELRAQDIVGRHGGDEFTLLLRRLSTDDAIAAAGRIAAAAQRRAGAQQLPALSLSFGLVQVGDGESVEAALRRADQALYEAKRQGRARAVAAQGDEERPVFVESRRLDLTPC
ncbi:MAG: GGDEF domain-containing protein [Rubrivivax sp.]|nr:GGDEF domain-containing protein [Rubrivivax sp.]